MERIEMSGMQPQHGAIRPAVAFLLPWPAGRAGAAGAGWPAMACLSARWIASQLAPTSHGQAHDPGLLPGSRPRQPLTLPAPSGRAFPGDTVPRHAVGLGIWSCHPIVALGRYAVGAGLPAMRRSGRHRIASQLAPTTRLAAYSLPRPSGAGWGEGGAAIASEFAPPIRLAGADVAAGAGSDAGEGRS